MSKPKKFRVLLTASASVHGYIEVVANSASHARSKHKEIMDRVGDVSWSYDGVDDDTVGIQNVEVIK